jgi:NAD(P)-dependent dehydrogenase (short-subunit alcohol dehydrogenase family)
MVFQREAACPLHEALTAWEMPDAVRNSGQRGISACNPPSRSFSSRELRAASGRNYADHSRAVERGRGHIAAISSMAGVRGIPFEPAYSASKAAVTAYLESLRSELRPRGITVTTIFPGYVQTPLLDAINGSMGADMSSGKAVTPLDAAVKIAKAIERGSSYTYFPWPLGLSVRLSALLPPRLYDRVMGQMFSRFPISRAEPGPTLMEDCAGTRTHEILGDHPVNAVLEHRLD